MDVTVAHHAYDHLIGFAIAFAGLLLVIWAERRARSRRRSTKSKS